MSYIEQDTAVRTGNGVVTINNGNAGNAAGTNYLVPVNNGNVVVKIFLCPTRGIRGNGLGDYNYLQLPTSVHYSPSGVSLGMITSFQGSSNTATVAHNGCNPRDYAIGPTPWYNCNQPSNGLSMPDSQFPPGQMSQFFSSPHPAGNLVLFADAHVQVISHAWLSANPSVWNWGDMTALPDMY